MPPGPVRAPDFWYGDAAGWRARALDPVSHVWRLGSAIRRAAARPPEMEPGTILVGNATLGGSGKTPATIALARHALKLGYRPHIVGHGYRARVRRPHRVDPLVDDAASVGDEALEQAAVAPTWVGGRRHELLRAAVGAGATLAILDDGLQDPRIRAAVALLAIDGDTGVGNGRVFPAGPLREPLQAALERADATLLIGEADGRLLAMLRGHPVIEAEIRPAVDPAHWRGRRVLGFAGLARPGKLLRTLTELQCEVVGFAPFPDHHPYQPHEIMRLIERAARERADLVTTAKDHVRLPALLRERIHPLPVALEFRDPTQLAQLFVRLHAVG